MVININLKKEDVFHEVARLAAYVGANAEGTSAYERISIVEENDELLERFWTEASVMATSALARFISDSSLGDTLHLSLTPSVAFNEHLEQGVQEGISAFLVNNIVARWFGVVNPVSAEGYATASTSYLQDAMRKLYHKSKPVKILR